MWSVIDSGNWGEMGILWVYISERASTLYSILENEWRTKKWFVKFS